MDRKTNLLLLALLALALLAGGTYALLTRTDGSGTEAAPQPVTDATTAPPAVRGGSESRPMTEPGEHEIVRQELGRERAVAADPEWEAALCGFTGRVVTAVGAPAAGRVVKLYRFEPSIILTPGLTLASDAAMEPRLDAGQSKTGTDGRFTIAGAYPRSVYVLVADAEGDSTTLQILERSPGPGELCDVGDVVLSVKATLTGIVVDAADRPVAGALVRAMDLPGALLAAAPVERFEPKGALLMRTLPDQRDGGKTVFEIPPWAQRRYEELPIPKATTDADGKFTLRNADPGVNCVMITKPDKASYVKTALPLKAGQQKDLGTIRLEDGETVSGRVLDQEGKPVAGAEVLVAQTSALAPIDFALRAPPTDEQGRFSCVGFRPGQATVAARRGPKEPWTIADPAAVTAELLVKLPSLSTLTVRLTSKQGKPLEKVRAKLFPSRAEGPWALLGLLRPLELANRVEVRDGGQLRVRELANGPYRLVLEATGHALCSLLVEVNGDTDTSVELDGLQPLLVRVADASGKPVRRASVYYQSSIPIPDCGDATGDDGCTTLQLPVTATTVAIAVDHPRFAKAQKSVKLPLAEVSFVLEAPGALAGLLTVKGQPPEAGKYLISVQRRWWETFGDRQLVPEMARFALPDGEGKFTVTGLAPGKYSVNAEPSFNAVRSFGGLFTRLSGLRGWSEPYVVVITSGQTATITLDAEKPAPITGPAARISGTVLVNGRPAEGSRIQGWGKRPVTGTVDAAGRFDLGLVEEGHVSLQVLPEGEKGGRNRIWSASFKHEAAKDRDLQIDVHVSSIAGIVYGSDGMPAAGAMLEGSLRSERAEDYSSWDAVADADGRFEIKHARTGKHRMRARIKAKGCSPWQDVDVQPGSGTAGVELRLLQTFRVSGRVDMTSLPALASEATRRYWQGMQLLPHDPEARRAQDGVGVSYDKEGKFRCEEGLFSGSYVAQVWREDGVYESLEPIVVGTQEVNDVTLRFRKIRDAAERKPQGK